MKSSAFLKNSPINTRTSKNGHKNLIKNQKIIRDDVVNFHRLGKTLDIGKKVAANIFF
jgi:hypothetical protein